MSLELLFADEPAAQALADDKLLAAMARFEGALARAAAQAGVVPAPEAELISRVCVDARFDAAALARAGRNAGTLAIPFVKELTEKVAAVSRDASRYVHFGATSQDVIDSAAVLCLRPAGRRIAELTRRVGSAAAELARRHAHTPTVARTLLQPAVPVPFGWKAAVWLSLLARSHGRFVAAMDEISVLQLGGPGGTLAAFAGRADAVAAALAADLGLRPPMMTWHSARDGFARLGAESAILTGALAKIARDVSLLMQPEIGELAEPVAPGRGGSSSLPHKRNPALCLVALEAGQRVPGLAASLLGQLAPEHERGLGQWQGQWFTLRQLFGATASAAAAMAEVLEGLQLDPQAMRANLERSRGLVFSEQLSLRVGRALADELCARAVRDGKPLREVVRADPRAALGEDELDRLFDPENAYGAAGAMIERALAMWRETNP